MARYTETFTVAKPLAVVTTACRLALHRGQWKVMDDSGWAFYGKEAVGLLGQMFRYPIKFAIFLRSPDGAESPAADGPVNVELHAAIFGFGPIPKMNLRKRTALLRAQIEHWLPEAEAEVSGANAEAEAE